jgi:hypothetical protein
MNDKVTQYITALDQEWQQEVCQELRKLIHEAEPQVTETIKWGAPFFEYAGPLCSVSTAREFARIVFMRGAELPSSPLFEAGEAKKLRTIKIREGQMVPAQEIIGLVREAIKLNMAA